MMAMTNSEHTSSSAAPDCLVSSMEHQRSFKRNFVLLNLAMLLDKADQALLPAVFLEVCQELGAGPSLLGTVTLCRGLAMSLIALAAGPLSKRFDRISVCSVGIALWAVATTAVGLSSSLSMLLVARTVNGLGLGLVVPVVFSLVSDMFAPAHRGLAFGILGCSSNLGGLAGAWFATELAASVSKHFASSPHSPSQ